MVLTWKCTNGIFPYQLEDLTKGDEKDGEPNPERD